MKTTTFLLLASIGISAAFFRPAQPHQQVAAVEIPRGGFFSAENKEFVDEGLDNPLVQADESITAARKCGFCMGVSIFLNYVLF
jgi:hypothetical protein